MRLLCLRVKLNIDYYSSKVIKRICNETSLEEERDWCEAWHGSAETEDINRVFMFRNCNIITTVVTS